MNAKSCVEFVLQAMNNVDDEYEKAEAANTQGNSGSTAGKTAKVWRGARCCWRWAM